MMEVNFNKVGLSGYGNAIRQESPEKERPTPTENQSTEPVDSVEVSAEAQAASQAQEQGIINRIKEEIEAGTYLTPERLDGAVDRLMAALSS